jgi:hypothetical protein
MPATLSTSNPLGIGYQTGFFSAVPGEPITQHFFDAAFAGRINENKIYKEAYHCNIIQNCGMQQWLEEYMGFDTDCYPAYTLLETYGQLNQTKIDETAVVPAYPGTVVLHIDASSTFVSNQFILPQVGNTLVAPPNGTLIKVTAASFASSGDLTITVQQRDTTGNTGAFTITAGDVLLVLSGSEISDCACPTGQFAFNDLPQEIDLRMVEIGDKGELCGEALHKCQWLKIPFHDECGNEVRGMWYTEALQQMYKRHEDRKYYETLFNPNFGMIPMLRAKGIKWNRASPTEITTDDVRDWKKQLDLYGVGCREFAIFAGRDLYSMFQRMLLAAGVVKLDNSLQPLNDCKWINMEYCGIKVEGLTLHIYDECAFSNGKQLGSANMVFPNSAIVIPMCGRPACTRSNGRQEGGAKDMKMMSMVYFRSQKTGEVWDNKTDSNGVLGPRNSFGAGCENHEWTIKSRWLNELHCINWWGYMGL